MATKWNHKDSAKGLFKGSLFQEKAQHSSTPELPNFTFALPSRPGELASPASQDLTSCGWIFAWKQWEGRCHLLVNPLTSISPCVSVGWKALVQPEPVVNSGKQGCPVMDDEVCAQRFSPGRRWDVIIDQLPKF